MKRIANLALIVLLFSTTTPSQNKAKDLKGWEETRWGMTSEEIGKVLGSRAQKLANFEGYGDGYYEYLVPDINIHGLTYTALLVMDRDSQKLSRVDVRLNEYESEKPREDVFDALDSMLTREYGAPDTKKDERLADQLTFSHTWRLQTSTVELCLNWRRDNHSGNVGISFYPTAAVSQTTK